MLKWDGNNKRQRFSALKDTFSFQLNFIFKQHCLCLCVLVAITYKIGIADKENFKGISASSSGYSSYY